MSSFSLKFPRIIIDRGSHCKFYTNIANDQPQPQIGNRQNIVPLRSVPDHHHHYFIFSSSTIYRWWTLQRDGGYSVVNNDWLWLFVMGGGQLFWRPPISGTSVLGQLIIEPAFGWRYRRRFVDRAAGSLTPSFLQHFRSVKYLPLSLYILASHSCIFLFFVLEYLWNEF